MMNLCSFLRIIKIHPLTYFYFIISIFSGYWKYYLGAYLLVCIHELCHLLMAYSFHFEIEKIELLPFGAYLSLNDFGFKPILYEMAVVLAGPSCHFFIYVILKDFSYIVFIQYLLKMNSLIFLFNLLPIYPMDGYRFILLMMQNFLDLQKSYHLSFKLSLFFLSLLVVQCHNLNNFIIFSFLFYSNILYYFRIPGLLRNYFMNIPYSYKSEKIKIHHKLKYNRDKQNYYHVGNYFYDEKSMKYDLIKNVKSNQK